MCADILIDHLTQMSKTVVVFLLLQLMKSLFDIILPMEVPLSKGFTYFFHHHFKCLMSGFNKDIISLSTVCLSVELG